MIRWILLLTSLAWIGCFVRPSHALAGNNAPTTYRYFAYGSNMAESVLSGLRSVSPLEASAAILPGYKLRFNLGGIGTSAACVEQRKEKEGALVHGVLYTLTPQDFALVGITEFVPVAYKWQRCRVYPYVGNGEEAGRLASKDASPVSAFTLVATFPDLNKEDLPTSQAYLNILKRSGSKWNLDRSYMETLNSTSVKMRGCR